MTEARESAGPYARRAPGEPCWVSGTVSDLEGKIAIDTGLKRPKLTADLA